MFYNRSHTSEKTTYQSVKKCIVYIIFENVQLSIIKYVNMHLRFALDEQSTFFLLDLPNRGHSMSFAILVVVVEVFLRMPFSWPKIVRQLFVVEISVAS